MIEFDSLSTVLLISDPSHYKNLRCRIIEFERGRAALRAQKQHSNRNKLTFQYPTDWDTAQVSQIREILDQTSRKHHEQNPGQTECDFVMVPVHPQQLSSNDFLVDKRPQLRLLTLAEEDQVGTGTSATLFCSRNRFNRVISV